MRHYSTVLSNWPSVRQRALVDMALDQVQSRLIVFDTDLSALVAVALDSGDRAIPLCTKTRSRRFRPPCGGRSEAARQGVPGIRSVRAG
jgi:hypothetical protein